MAMTAIAPEILETAQWGTVLKVSRKELKGTVSSRWFWMWVVAFVALAAVLVLVALPGSRAHEGDSWVFIAETGKFNTAL